MNTKPNKTSFKKGDSRLVGNSFKKGLPAWNKGKRVSDSERKRLASLRTGKKPWNKDKKLPNQSGKNHGRWKGGFSRGYRIGYYSLEYKKWRLAVFERDHYICQGCSMVGGYLTAHHIKNQAHYPKLRYNLNNGITLCEKCHSLTDNYKGRANSRVRLKNS